MYYFRIFLLIILVLNSCRPEQTIRTIEPVESMIIDSLLAPTGLIIKDSIFIVFSSRQDNIIKIFERQKGLLLAEGGHKGKGPGEQLNIASLQYMQTTNTVWSYDLILKKNIYYALDSILTEFNYLPGKFVRLDSEVGQLYNPLFLNDSTIIALGFFGPERLVFLNSNGKLISLKGELPIPDDKDIPYYIHAQAYQSYMCLKPDRTRLAINSRHCNLLEIYTTSGDIVQSVYTGKPYKPLYEVSEAGESLVCGFSEETTLGYIGITCDDEYIMGLYCGKSFSAVSTLSNYGIEIHIADWNGKVLDKFLLEKPLSCFYYYPEENSIYGFHINSNQKLEIVKYSVEIECLK